MTEHQNAGSYDFGMFSPAEIGRLITQGRATWDEELPLLEWAGLQPGASVLDLGCGPGVISGLIADYVGQLGRVTGVDISDELLNIGRSLNGDRVQTLRGSVYDLRSLSGAFDFVYVRLVMQHVDRPLEALAEIRRTLKPGGRLCILDSCESILAIQPPPPGMEDLLAETQLLQRIRGGDRFVGGKLAMYLREAGFANVKSRILLITPEMVGIGPFLDTVLTWRPQLYPDDLRDKVGKRVSAMAQCAESTMIEGYNGAFVVCGVNPD